MQSDWVFWLVEKVRYPWVSRIDRSVYKSHSALDPVELARVGLVAAVGGYWVGRVFGKSRAYYAIGAATGIVACYLGKEWSISSELRGFDEVDFKMANKISFFSRAESLPEESQKKPVQQAKVARFRNIRKFPELQIKIYNAKDFINQLSANYFI